jgi:ABC-type nitrate/sulfonate/bicarbonate transport system substrate-binding protein
MLRLLGRRRLLQLAGGTAAWFQAGCSERRSSSGKDRIRVSAAPTLSMCALYLAQELGYFSEAGLDVAVHEVNTPNATIAMLAGGKIDVSFTAFSPSVINALVKGARLKIVAGREIASPLCGDFGAVYTTKSRFPIGAPDFHWLRGKRIAVRRAAGLSEFAVEIELASVGLPPSAVQAVPFAEAEAVAALLGGHVDGLVSQGNIERGHAAAGHLVRTPGLGRVLPNFQYSHVLFGATLLDLPPDVGGRFLAAYLHASREFLQGKTPAFMERFAQSNNLDFQRVRAACRNTYAQDGEIDFESMRRVSDWAIRKSYCAPGLSRELALDQRFLDIARRSAATT